MSPHARTLCGEPSYSRLFCGVCVDLDELVVYWRAVQLLPPLIESSSHTRAREALALPEMIPLT